MNGLTLANPSLMGSLGKGYIITDTDYSGASVAVSIADTNPRSIAWSTDGKYMFISGEQTFEVHRFTASRAFDISTIDTNPANIQSSVLDGANDSPYGIFFRSDGHKMYVTDILADAVFEYDLATAWDIESPSLSLNGSYSIPIAIQPRGLSFDRFGDHMYIATPSGGGTAASIRHFPLSTSWDITTASLGTDLLLTGIENQPHGIAIHPDGISLITVGVLNDEITQFNLPTRYILTGAVNAGFKEASTEDSQPGDLWYNHNGRKLYMMGRGNQTVYEYDMNIQTA